MFSLGYLNPYFTDEGISRGYSFSYQETDGFDANITASDSKVMSGSVKKLNCRRTVFLRIRYRILSNGKATSSMSSGSAPGLPTIPAMS